MQIALIAYFKYFGFKIVIKHLLCITEIKKPNTNFQSSKIKNLLRMSKCKLNLCVYVYIWMCMCIYVMYVCVYIWIHVYTYEAGGENEEYMRSYWNSEDGDHWVQVDEKGLGRGNNSRQGDQPGRKLGARNERDYSREKSRAIWLE